MRQSFQDQLEALQNDLLRMGTLVEQSIDRAVNALKERDVAAAERVVADDDQIDDMHLDIERRCLELLALQQPMAKDLRTIGTALKIVTDLERMADHATDIAKITIRLEGRPLIKPLVDIPRMARIAQDMTRDALTAFVRRDAELARTMTGRDDEVDHLYREVFRELLSLMTGDPDRVEQATYLLFTASYLERIADHATNLGEWIIYMVTGGLEELNR